MGDLFWFYKMHSNYMKGIIFLFFKHHLNTCFNLSYNVSLNLMFANMVWHSWTEILYAWMCRTNPFKDGRNYSDRQVLLISFYGKRLILLNKVAFLDNLLSEHLTVFAESFRLDYTNNEAIFVLSLKWTILFVVTH